MCHCLVSRSPGEFQCLQGLAFRKIERVKSGDIRERHRAEIPSIQVFKHRDEHVAFVFRFRLEEFKKRSAHQNTCLHREIRENPVRTLDLMAGIENHPYLLRRWLAQYYSQRMIEQFQISKAIGDMLVKKFTLIEAHGFHFRFRFKRVEQNRENEIRISANLNRPLAIRGQGGVDESRSPKRSVRRLVWRARTRRTRHYRNAQTGADPHAGGRDLWLTNFQSLGPDQVSRRWLFVGQTEHGIRHPALEGLVVHELLEQLRVVVEYSRHHAAEGFVMLNARVLLV